MVLLHTPNAALGSPAPPFDLPGTDGKVHSLQSSRGPKGLLVMFICNHCPYVQAIRERLAVDAADLLAAGIGVVGISSNDAAAYPEDSFANMKKLANSLAFPYAYLYDESQAVARAYAAVCTPDFFGYDADLKLKYRGRLDAAQRAARPPGMRRELVEAMLEIAHTGTTQIDQVPSMGCSIKYRK